MVSPDPFRDVIKTEPAPDLPSLIEDMLPYLTGQESTTSSSTTPMTTSVNQKNQDPQESSQALNLPESQTFGNYDYHHYNESSNDHSVKFVPIGIENSSKFNKTFSTNLENGNNSLSSLGNSSIIQSNYNEEKLNISKINNDLLSSSLRPNKPDFSLNKTEEFFQSEENDSIFSLDSVLDLFFSESTTLKPPKNTTIKESMKQTETSKEMETKEKIAGKGELETKKESTAGKEITKLKETMKQNSSSRVGTSNIISDLIIASSTLSSIQGSTNSEINLNPEIKTKTSENEIPVFNVLKLAGCNIYGRMYRVGKIITELSTACLECRCTEIGVQCKQLVC